MEAQPKRLPTPLFCPLCFVRNFVSGGEVPQVVHSTRVVRVVPARARRTAVTGLESAAAPPIPPIRMRGFPICRCLLRQPSAVGPLSILRHTHQCGSPTMSLHAQLWCIGKPNSEQHSAAIYPTDHESVAGFAALTESGLERRLCASVLVQRIVHGVLRYIGHTAKPLAIHGHPALIVPHAANEVSLSSISVCLPNQRGLTPIFSYPIFS